MKTQSRAMRCPTARARWTGFSLIELMVAITLSLLITAAMAGMFVQSSRARDELQRANQQIENGRYALETLTDDLQHAGFFAQFNIANAGLATPGTLPDPCATALATLRTAMPLHIQGYDNTTIPGPNNCGTRLSDYKADTDILVIRRVSTCVRGATDCAAINGAPYFQASLCNNASELGSNNATNFFRLDTTIANLDRHRKDCTATAGSGTLAAMRQYLTHIYFVANNNNAGDGIPTLMRLDLGAGNAFSDPPIPIAEGIENLQIEYGVDSAPVVRDGVADAFMANPGTTDNWRDVVLAKIYILARNNTETVGYEDVAKPTGCVTLQCKTYTMGLMADGVTANTVGPFDDSFKRHAYQSVVKLINVAGRREL